MNLTCLKSGIWQVELRIPSDVRDSDVAGGELLKLGYMKVHRNAYGERMTEAQERQLERRLTRLCELI